MRFVLLDADDTLFDYKKAEHFAIKQTLGEMGVVAPGAREVYKRINAGLWRDLEKGLIQASALRLRRFELLTKELGLDFDPKKASDFYVAALSEGCFLLPESLGVLQELKRRGHKVAIVTNGFRSIQTRRLRLAGIGRYIDTVVISEDVGAQKPQPKMLEVAMARLGCTDKAQALMVGDSLTSDMQAAKNAGIQAVWYNPEHKALPPDATFSQVHTLSSILSII